MMGYMELSHLEKVIQDMKARGSSKFRIEEKSPNYHGPFGPFSSFYQFISDNGDIYTMMSHLEERPAEPATVKRFEQLL